MSMISPEEVRLMPGATLGDALASLQRSGKGAAIACDDAGRLLALYTDGDVRRLMLAGATAASVLNPEAAHDPVVAHAGLSDKQALALMDQHRIDQLPVVDRDGRFAGLHIRRALASRIFLSAPHLGDDELRFVHEAFETNWIAPLGPNVDAFEQEMTTQIGGGHAAALSSGTAAIHLALRLLDVGPGDMVVCSSLTFVASANPILYQGATPIFVDSERESWNICPDALERTLAELAREGRQAKALIAVDLYGQSARYDLIAPICERYGVPIIEDAAEALGATYRGKACGTFGRFGVFSFNGNKIITTSGGGMLIANREEPIVRARKLATQAREQAAHYEHTEVGYNYRMSNVLAGIGRGQLRKLDDRVQTRRAIFEWYREELDGVAGIEWMPECEGSYSTRWLTACLLGDTQAPARVIAALERLQIEARMLWKPMHLQPLFKGARYVTRDDGIDVSHDLFSRGLCLPSSSSMTREQVDRICDGIRAAFSQTNRRSTPEMAERA